MLTQHLIKALRRGTSVPADYPEVNVPHTKKLILSLLKLSVSKEGGGPVCSGNVLYFGFLELGQRKFKHSHMSITQLQHCIKSLSFFSSWENSTEFFHIPWGCFEMSKMASEH